MTLENFIPEIWSARLLQNLHKNLVYGQPGIINRDYQGEISSAGDTVRINSIGPVTVSDYVKNTDHAVPEVLTDAQLTLLIDQQKMFNFQIDDIDQVQQMPKVMDEAMREAGYALADTADQFIAGLYTEVNAANAIGTDGAPIVPTATTAYEHLVDASVMLTENNVPKSGRWIVVPAWFEGMLLKDDRYVKVGSAASDAVLRNGMVGRAAGFDILVSNNVPNTTGTLYKLIAGVNNAWSFADQINKVEAFRPERRFGDAMKGLHVYGAKVVRDTSMVVLTMNKS